MNIDYSCFLSTIFLVDKFASCIPKVELFHTDSTCKNVYHLTSLNDGAVFLDFSGLRHPVLLSPRWAILLAIHFHNNIIDDVVKHFNHLNFASLMLSKLDTLMSFEYWASAQIDNSYLWYPPWRKAKMHVVQLSTQSDDCN